jgi:hypothetical protein
VQERGWRGWWLEKQIAGGNDRKKGKSKSASTSTSNGTRTSNGKAMAGTGRGGSYFFTVAGLPSWT